MQASLTEFVKALGGTMPDHVIQLGRRFYNVQPEQNTLRENIANDVYSCGTPLGEQKKTFQPSLALLDHIAKTTERKIIINKKSAWLFLCGRDVFKTGITKTGPEGLVIVQNKHRETLGYGIHQKGEIKNLLDKGHFLRREH